MFNKPITFKHLFLFLASIFLIGAGIAAGTGLFDNVQLNSYLDFKTPTVTPATSAAGTSRIYYNSTNQGLDICSNACTTSQPLMNGRNRFINGNMNIWQRGTSATNATGTLTYLVDRWFLGSNVTGSTDISQATAISGVNGSYNAILIQPHTTNTAGTSSIIDLCQIIEGYNLIPLNNQVCTISFWAKTNVTGTYGIALQDSASSVSYLIDWVVSNTNWNKYVYTFTHSNATGTWNYTNGSGLQVKFTLICGSSFQGTAGTWQAGNKFASTNISTNTFTNSTSNFMYITQVQIEKGPTATDFEQLDYQTEFAHCQRYYQVWPAQTAVQNLTWVGIRGGANQMWGQYIPFPVTMRTSPSFLTNSCSYVAGVPNANNQITCYDYANAQYYTPTGAVTINTGSTVQNAAGFQIYLTAATSFNGTALGQGILFQLGGAAQFGFSADF